MKWESIACEHFCLYIQSQQEEISKRYPLQLKVKMRKICHRHLIWYFTSFTVKEYLKTKFMVKCNTSYKEKSKVNSKQVDKEGLNTKHSVAAPYS